MDHPRDLFLMVNHFRHLMKRPIVGFGHSMGGNNLVNLSLMHPRLFTTLVLMDPVIQRWPNPKANFAPARASARRRDRWPSRKIAAEAFKKSKFYQTWDPRVLENWIQYGLRDLPTTLHPEVQSSGDVEVTLSTTKHQEVMSFLRGNFPTKEHPFPSFDPDRLAQPDIDMNTFPPNAPFVRSEPHSTFQKLPFVRPSVFYVFGEHSDLSDTHLQADKLSMTGVGVGGSGGKLKGRVDAITMEGVGHLIPMENVNGTADAAASWIAPEIDLWRKNEDIERSKWAAIPKEKRSLMPEEYVKTMAADWSKILADEKTKWSKL